ncbi:unnamed protein product [Spirodela intermedia]|uniref:Uncharacterized protein n=1 Tax=Spirodela intermedia TaxID=51605 RepID=A0A7I8KPT9_SPIIN|nr:unnamed protein product [Spirodela intermedia]
MGLVIERVEWEPGSRTFFLLFCSCLSSIFLFPYLSKKSTVVVATNARAAHSSLLEFGSTTSFLSFQRSFLFIYSLASVIGGLQTVFGEDEYQHYGASREQMVLCLCAGIAATLSIGSFLGVLSDIFGPRKACITYCILHLFVDVLRSISAHPIIWMSSVCLALASFIFLFSFETWMTTEHERQGHRQDLLTDTFWLMIFFESASLIGSQALANLLVTDLEKGFFLPSAPAALLSLTSILCIRKMWNGHKHFASFRDYGNSFCMNILRDKRIWLLAGAQGCLHFSVSIFWILWAPTIVADGRDVNLSLIYPCFLGSRMLGSTTFPWLSGAGSSNIHNEDYLSFAFAIAGLSLTLVAYDYQEIGVLVVLFCVFHACCGLIFPSLARLRTAYVPNELRGGMMSLSFAPANAIILLVVVQGGYYRNLSNAWIVAFSALGLFIAAGFIQMLKRWRKHPHPNWRKL